MLFAIRWKLGELLGWDGPATGLGSRVPTLRDRLPADLHDASPGPDFDALPFSSLYMLDDDGSSEIIVAGSAGETAGRANGSPSLPIVSSVCAMVASYAAV